MRPETKAHRPLPDNQSPIPNNRSAFTLVELLAVIAIIGILVGMIAGIAGLAARKSDRARAIAALEAWRDAVEEYRNRSNMIPPFDTATKVDTMSFGNRIRSGLQDELAEKLENTDPWGNPYYYQRKGKFLYRLWSTGPDLLLGTDDITAESTR